MKEHNLVFLNWIVHIDNKDKERTKIIGFRILSKIKRMDIDTSINP
jgi:hypothetical protein